MIKGVGRLKRAQIFVPRVLSLILLAICVVPLGCTKTAVERQKKEGLKLAVQVPLSGPLKDRGQAILNGIMMALDEKIPALDDAGLSVGVVPYDEGHPDRAVANAELITSDPSVIGVIGHFDSAAAVPASERYNQAGIPFLSVAATSPQLTERQLPVVFRIGPRDEEQVDVLALLVEKLRVRTAWIVHDRTLYGQGFADLFKKRIEGRGLKVLGYSGIARGSRDFRDLVSSIKDAGPELVFFGGTFAEGGPLLVEIRRQGVKAVFVGGDGLDSPAFYRISLSSGGEVYLTSLSNEFTDSNRGRTWAQRYFMMFGVQPDALAALSYDSANLMLQAILYVSDRGGVPQRHDVLNSIREIPVFEGVTGRIAFDNKGDNTFSLEGLSVYKVEGDYPGKPIKVTIIN